MSEGFERRFKGRPVSPGIAMGTLRVEARGCTAPVIRTISPTEIEAEWQRFEEALSRTEGELNALKARVEELSGASEAAIFDAHLLFLRRVFRISNPSITRWCRILWRLCARWMMRISAAA